jgi:type IV secretory pathway VirB6-like protein
LKKALHFVDSLAFAEVGNFAATHQPSGRVSEKIDSISPDSQAQQSFLAIANLDLGRLIGIYYSVFFCVAFSSTFHCARMTLLVAILAPLGPLWLMVAACGPNMYW